MWPWISMWFCRWVAAQSVFYHLYNQVSYMSLDEISPLTFSIGNTMKRISVIVASIIIFHTPVQPINALGAAIAILGTFIYSQVDFPHMFYQITFFTKEPIHEHKSESLTKKKKTSHFFRRSSNGISMEMAPVFATSRDSVLGM